MPIGRNIQGRNIVGRSLRGRSIAGSGGAAVVAAQYDPDQIYAGTGDAGGFTETYKWANLFTDDPPTTNPTAEDQQIQWIDNEATAPASTIDISQTNAGQRPVSGDNTIDVPLKFAEDEDTHLDRAIPLSSLGLSGLVDMIAATYSALRTNIAAFPAGTFFGFGPGLNFAGNQFEFFMKADGSGGQSLVAAKDGVEIYDHGAVSPDTYFSLVLYLDYAADGTSLTTYYRIDGTQVASDTVAGPGSANFPIVKAGGSSYDGVEKSTNEYMRRAFWLIQERNNTPISTEQLDNLDLYLANGRPGE